MTSIVQEFLKLFNSMIEESKSNELILEGMISVPESVLKPIKNYYLKVYRLYKLGKIQEPFPEKPFTLDFRGTKWEHLLDKSKNLPKVTISFSLDGTYQFSDDQGHVINFALDLSKDRGETVSVDLDEAITINVEHEMGHVIQTLLQKKSGYANAGLPSKKVLPTSSSYKKLDYEGNYIYKKSKAIRKTPIHTKRPAEHYPDLLSSIRNLRLVFEKEVLRDPFGGVPEALKKDTEKNRNLFFKQAYRELLNGNIKNPFGFHILDYAWQFKKAMKIYRKLNEKMWRKMITIAYDEFVNKGPNFDYTSMKRRLSTIENEIKKQQQRQQEQKEQEEKTSQNNPYENGEEDDEIYDTDDTNEEEEEYSLYESADYEPTWEDIIKGEWWLNKDGTSDYADQDVGEAGHEMIAIKNLLSEFSDNFREAFEEETISGDNIREFIESDDFEYLEYAYHNNEIPDSIGVKAMGELWNEMKKDSRSAYSKHTGAILVINHNFAAWKIDAASLRAMQDFIWELMSENKINLKNAEVVVSEQSTGNYNSIPVDNFLQLKGPRQLWMINEMKKKDQHSWRAKLGKNTFVDECRMCLVLKINSDHGTYYRFPDSDEAIQKCPPCNRTNLNSNF